MLIWPILFIALLGLGYWGYSHIRALPADKQRGAWIKVALWGTIVIAIIATATGRLHWLGAVIAALVGIGKIGIGALMRFVPIIGSMKRANLFGSPSFNTPYLQLQLDLNNNRLDGKVVDGPYAGTPLAQLDKEAFSALETFYQEHDQRSYYLIRIIRRQYHATNTADDNQQMDGHSLSEPSYQEALNILGLTAQAEDNSLTKQDIIAAHRRLIQKLHPDRGGNDYLAACINAAKQTLIAHIEKHH